MLTRSQSRPITPLEMRRRLRRSESDKWMLQRSESATDPSRPSSPHLSLHSHSSLGSWKTHGTDIAEHIVSLAPSGLPSVSWRDNHQYIGQVMRLWGSYVYHSKIEDMNVFASDDRELRFHDIFIEAGETHSIKIQENNLGATAAYALASLLAHDELFIHLDLSANQLQDRGTIALASMLITNQSLVLIDLRSNDIGHHGAISLSEALKLNKCLTQLDLGVASGSNRNHIGIRGAQALSEALAQNQVLTALSISGNGVSVAGAEALSQGLYENTSLLRLDIASNGIDALGCEALCKSLMRSPIEELIMSRNNIGDLGAANLDKVIKFPSSLRYLDISHNSIGVNGGLAIGNALKVTNQLETLILDRNLLTHQGCYEIFEALRESHIKLQHLSLCNNKLDGSVGSVLADSLTHNSTLTKLNLSGNRISDEGCLGIARALSVNKTLKILDISYNRIGTLSGIQLFRSIRANTALSHLYLKYNKIQDQAGPELLETLTQNSNLLHVDVNFNELNYRSLVKVDHHLNENNKVYKRFMMIRYMEEIEQLKADEVYMEKVKKDLAKRAQATVQMQLQANRFIEKTHNLERDIKRRVAEREKKLMEIIQLKQKVDLEIKETNSTNFRVKTDKEAKYRSLMTRLQRETDVRARTEKKLRQAHKDIEDSQLNHLKKVKELTALIKAEADLKSTAQTFLNYHTNNLNGNYMLYTVGCALLSFFFSISWSNASSQTI
eukprot:TRINITY_DN4873_c0_g2_i3.p1 TRINITY_DN4873_c0_g2~~TRINITY_DN4873_c0_g2_i3.p1  ORF type:complete len:726 (-),score=136.02 TRINITY_DN4873_c0_g2_i3:110-2287(-)